MAGTKLGYIKAKLGLRGVTKPGDMISRMNKLKMKDWEKSSMDSKQDSKSGHKEGSKEDNKADKKDLKVYNSKVKTNLLKIKTLI